MAKQVKQILALYGEDGDYIARSNDPKLVPFISSLIEKLGDAKKLTLVTETDIKVFEISPKVVVQGPMSPEDMKAFERVSGKIQVIRDEYAPPQEEDAQDAFERELARQEAVEREMKAVPTGDGQDAPDDSNERPARRKRERPTAEDVDQLRPVKSCGRCNGTGSTAGGGVCPVCKGNKVTKPWGIKRRR